MPTSLRPRSLLVMGASGAPPMAAAPGLAQAGVCSPDSLSGLFCNTFVTGSRLRGTAVSKSV